MVIRKSKVNKPTYIRMCILELSKVLMYEFHYDHIKNKYDNESRLLLTDTDSLIYEIKTEDVYKDFSNDKEMFDFSESSTKSKYYDDSNKLVIDKIKNETAGVAIEEVFGLKPKIYIYTYICIYVYVLADNNSDHKKAKGVVRNAGKKLQ